MKLFSPYQLAATSLKNRVVMAPMTRSRAVDNLANDIMAEYYGQRASAGLIIAEGVSPSPNGLGYPRMPGIYSQEQTQSWKTVTKEVHRYDGKIFVQLMHAGRISNVLNLPAGAEVVGPSLIAAKSKVWTDSQGELSCDPPREMTAADIKTAVKEYAHAASNAIAAGFDGVEIHCANGYLINQFLDPGANQRVDSYGAGANGRNRFAIEIAKAIVDAIGADRVGFRISPYGVVNDMSGAYDGIADQYAALVTEFGGLNLAYVHMVDHSSMGAPTPDVAVIQDLCSKFCDAGGDSVILSGGYDRERAEADLNRGAADLIAFGRPFISNPDLVERLQTEAPLASPDTATFYSPGPVGYTDYPVASKK